MNGSRAMKAGAVKQWKVKAKDCRVVLITHDDVGG